MRGLAFATICTAGAASGNIPALPHSMVAKVICFDSKFVRFFLFNILFMPNLQKTCISPLYIFSVLSSLYSIGGSFSHTQSLLNA